MKALAAAVIVLGGLGGVASADDGLVAPAAELVEPGGEQEWGTTTDNYHAVLAHELQLIAGTEGLTNSLTMARTCTAGACHWVGGVHLPAGAQIMSLEVSACDASTTAEIVFALRAVPRTPGPITSIVSSTTGLSNTFGCTVYQVPLATPYTVINMSNGILLQVLADTGLNWTQARVRYRLQVSQGPSVASFPLDVPTTHPMYRFVEAMAASGLTGGCAAGRFCPDTPVTRGQLAVFLASALGLHFPY